MNKQELIKSCLPGSTDEVAGRYARKVGKPDSVHGTPEFYNEVYGALARLRKKGEVSSRSVFGGSGAYVTVWSLKEDDSVQD